MPYAIDFVRAARRELAALPREVAEVIRPKIDALATNPRPPGCQKLSGDIAVWRIRSGNYRIVYEIDDRVVRVLVIRIAHRREVYRGL